MSSKVTKESFGSFKAGLLQSGFSIDYLFISSFISSSSISNISSNNQLSSANFSIVSSSSVIKNEIFPYQL
jgi:hypothetical protein